jgi:hypothetical protein
MDCVCCEEFKKNGERMMKRERRKWRVGSVSFKFKKVMISIAKNKVK